MMTQPQQKTQSSDAIVQWGAEYARGGIPSSQRSTPSGALIWAWQQLAAQHNLLRRAIDIGCGKGRNSLFLAQQGLDVTAMDFTPAAIAALTVEAKAQNLDSKIRAIAYDVTEGWPVPSDSQDFAVDAFCFKHIIGREARDAYKDNLFRALRVHGFYMISFASIGDGYYGQYIKERKADGAEATIVDPANDIASVLYTRERVVSYFHPHLQLIAERHQEKIDTMHGKTWPRSTYALLFRRTFHKM
jgi:SAM-dependent methyltransferase